MDNLGTAQAPSGKLLIVDPGFLRLWSGAGEPIVRDGVLSPEDTARSNDCVDLELRGPGAEAVGRSLDLQWHPRFLFDMPRDRVDLVHDQVMRKARELGVQVDVEPMRRRVSHRERVDLALAHGRGAGEIIFQDIWAVAFGDLPNSPLRIVAEPMPTGHVEEGRLRRVIVEVREGDVAESERVGYVVVDYARLLVIDADAVATWTSDESLDGLADAVFWGRDEVALATRLGATKHDDGVFGWRDLPMDEAVARSKEIAEVRAANGWLVAADFRPHSHLYELMKQVRASEPGAGVVSIGGAVACGFATSWGDGIFEVHRDLDRAGRLLRIRIELGTDERVRLMARVTFRWSTSALVSRKVIDEGMPVRFMYREATDRPGDSGWRLFSGFESESYNDDANNIAVVRLSDLPEDKAVDRLLDEPVGSVFEKTNDSETFVRVTDWSPDT